MGDLGSTFAVMCRQSYWWRHSWKNYIFPVKTIEFFAGIFPTKLNYESIVEGRGSKSPSLLKMTFQETSEAAPRPVLCKRFSENISQISLIYQNSYQYYTITKPIKDFFRNKIASLFLKTLLRKWTSYLFFLKSRHFTEQVYEGISQIEGV